MSYFLQKKRQHLNGVYYIWTNEKWMLNPACPSWILKRITHTYSLALVYNFWKKNKSYSHFCEQAVYKLISNALKISVHHYCYPLDSKS